MRILQANSQKYVSHISRILQRARGTDEIMKEPGLFWFLVEDKGKYIATAYAYGISNVRCYLSITFLPEEIHNKQRKKAGQSILKYLSEKTNFLKFETTVPTIDTVETRLFTQIGFKREGVSRSSIVVDGVVRDQYYLGHVVKQ